MNKKSIRRIRLGHLKNEKFAPIAHTTNPQLQYNGGPVLANAEVFTIFWGGAWNNQPALANLSQSINDFFKVILTSPLIDQLAEYSVPQLDFFTLTSSHELCEAITDPVPGQGWYWFKDQKHQGEIGDICESAPNAEERMGVYLVQREWSNHLKGCV